MKRVDWLSGSARSLTVAAQRRSIQLLAAPWRRHYACRVETRLDPLCRTAAKRRQECRRGSLRGCATIVRQRAYLASLCAAFALLLAGCGAQGSQPDPKVEAPPPTRVVDEPDASMVKVEHPEQFPLAVATAREAVPETNVTGVVNPDVSRTVPVISLASGRVVEIHAKLGDTVAKGQLLMRVQSSDISSAFSEYRHAKADEKLAAAQLSRAQLLFDKGAIAQKEVELAQDADEKAKVDVETALERLKVLGADIDHPAALVDIYAPVSGVIV
jgi:cobalt-zinc-cadmium efflux system membrane fusion protein